MICSDSGSPRCLSLWHPILFLFIAICHRSVNPTALGAQARPPLAQIQKEVRIGSMWDEEEALTQINKIASYGDSLLLVLEGIEHAIRVYDWDGNLVNRLGRFGNGPGEFRHPASLQVIGDTILVQNNGTRSLIFLRIDGEEIERLSYAPIVVASGTRAVMVPTGILPDGTFLGVPTASRPQFEKERTEYAYPIMKLSRTGTVLDTLALVKTWIGRRFHDPPSGTRPAHLPSPQASDVTAWSATVGLVAVADLAPRGGDHQYRLTAIRHTGDTVFNRFYPFEPQRMSRSVIEAHVRDTWLARRSARWRDAVERAYSEFPFQRPVTMLRIDPESRIWVARERVPGQPRRWDVLNPQGAPLFSVEFAVGSVLRLVRGDRIWLEERNEFDVPFIVRYRVLPPR